MSLGFKSLIKLAFFSADFRKILKSRISRKSVQWKPSCFARTYREIDRQTDRQTDRHDEANGSFLPSFQCA